jgi:hypothetical protein
VCRLGFPVYAALTAILLPRIVYSTPSRLDKVIGHKRRQQFDRHVNSGLTLVQVARDDSSCESASQVKDPGDNRCRNHLEVMPSPSARQR